MAFRPFAADYAGSVPNVDDPGKVPEANMSLPWVSDPAASWLDYQCWVEVDLDAGMVLHKPLPQANPDPDTLAAIAHNSPHLDAAVPAGPGVKVAPNAAITDVVQRMATSTYRFILKGWGLRAGYQVPIPGIISIAGITPVPDRIQRAANLLVGNFSGVPIFFAYWELHYILPRTPSQAGTIDLVPFNPALHIRPDAKLPGSIGLPVAPTDMAATQTVAKPGTIGPPSAARGG